MNSVSSSFKSLSKNIKMQDINLTYNGERITLNELKYSFEGNLFQTIMQQIEVTSKEDLSSIKDQNVDFSYGIMVDSAYEYVDKGSYYIKDLEEDIKNSTTTVTGYDKMLNFMVDYDLDDMDLEYPCTLLEFVTRMCEVCDVDLYTTSFFNSDLTVDEDYFSNQSMTYRDILEQVAQATLTTIFIKNDKLYLCPISTTVVETLDISYLTDLTISDKFGAVNSLVLGRGDVEDNIEARDDDDIETNGKCELRFDENEFLDSYREAVIDSMFEELQGLEYYAVESSNLGCMWLEPCDCIAMCDRNDNAYTTYVLEMSVTLNTGVTSSSINADVPEESTTTYSVTTDEMKATLKVERLADKNAGLIEDIVEQITDTSDIIAQILIEIGSITQTVSADTYVNTDLTETGELHLTDTISGADYLYTLQITGAMTAGTVTLVISDVSRSSEDEATTTEIDLVLPEDTEEITYKNGVFYSGDTELKSRSIELLDVDTYIYIKEYEDLTYYANYDKYYSILAQLSLKVDTDTLLSTISAQADNIYFESGILTFTSGNFLLDETGHVVITNGLDIKQVESYGAGLELFGEPPYIDFHYGDSEEDYTSRIIETASGILEIEGSWRNCPISDNYGDGYAMHGADDKEYTYQIKYESDKLKFYVDGEQIASLYGDNTGDGSSTGDTSSGGSSFPSTGTSSRTIFGIKRNINSTSTAWERTDDAQGLTIENATTDGSEVTNAFDDLYPWCDIITCNYDTENCEITAYYGDTDFTFTPGENMEVMTIIPELWYRRWQKTDEDSSITYEYIQIATYEVDSSYTYVPAFMVGRYPTSGSSERLHSRSGTSPLCSITAENFRTYSRSLGDNWNEMDIWHLAVIQMLYLVEYADYNCQNTVGMCSTNNLDSGGCDYLGMASGSLTSNETYSSSYRGMEDLWGNVYYYIDGINIISYVPYVCEDDDSYTYDSSASPYTAVSATLPSKSGYITNLSYDANYPSIMLPTAVGGSSSTYIPDYYTYGSGNRVLLAGGTTGGVTSGLWCTYLYTSTNTNTANGGRLLYNRKKSLHIIFLVTWQK